MTTSPHHSSGTLSDTMPLDASKAAREPAEKGVSYMVSFLFARSWRSWPATKLPRNGFHWFPVAKPMDFHGFPLPNSFFLFQSCGALSSFLAFSLRCAACGSSGSLSFHQNLICRKSAKLIYNIYYYLRGGDESQGLVGTETGEWRAWQGLRLGVGWGIVWEAEEHGEGAPVGCLWREGKNV